MNDELAARHRAITLRLAFDGAAMHRLLRSANASLIFFRQRIA